jgi:glycosyltransferase involved in cell wall biosynthesis
MVPVFLSQGYLVELLGWERVKGECHAHAWRSEDVSEKPILRGGGYVTRLARLMYPLWMLVVFWRVIFLGRRKFLFCLGWETAFPASLAACLTGSRVVFDDADRFSMILRLPAPAHSLLIALERWTSHQADIHLVPGWTRYEWRHPKMILLRNTPTTDDFARARELIPQQLDADFVIYANGWIGETRGAPVFLELMQRLHDTYPRIKLIAAGWTNSESGRQLFAMPNVHYYGEVPTHHALALYHICDVVLTFYDPTVPINRQAESNKWGDCVFIGKPFIVNTEVETARSLVERGVGYSVPYNDVDALLSLILRLSRRDEKLCSSLLTDKRIITEYQPFDISILSALKIMNLERS